MIDLHTHTTASDGRCTPAELVARAAARPASPSSASPITTRSPAASRRPPRARAARHRVRRRHRDHRRRATRPTSTCSATSSTRVRRRCCAFLADAAPAAARSRPADDRQARGVRHPPRRRRDPPAGARRPEPVGRAPVDCARAGRRRATSTSTNEAFDSWLSRGKPAFVPREGAAPDEVIARIHDAGGIASLAHPGLVGRDEWIPPLAAAGLDALEAYHTDHDTAATGALSARWRSGLVSPCPAAPTFTATSRTARRRPGTRVAAARGLRAARCSRPAHA